MRGHELLLKHKWSVAILSGCIISSLWFCMGIREYQKEIQETRAYLNVLLAWKERNPTTQETPPWIAQAGEEDAVHAFTQAGLVIVSREELPSEEKKSGSIEKENILLQGNYIQLLRGFDIIKDKYRGASFTILHITRINGELSIKGEFRTFRSRGIYEEEKHSSHWSDGNREKSSGADSS